MLVFTPRFQNQRPHQARNWSPNDREARIFAHMSAVANEVEHSRLEMNNEIVPVTIHMPTLEPLLLPIALKAPLPTPERGQIVRLRYRWRGEAFATQTRIRTRLSGVDWLLDLPKEVIPSKSRLFFRQPCDRNWRIIAKGLGPRGGELPLEIRDISAAGVCVYIDHSLVQRIRDRLVVGLLMGPGAHPMPVRFKVTHVRFSPETAEGQPISLQALAAGPFKGIGLLPHQRLAEAVEEHRQPLDARALLGPECTPPPAKPWPSG